MKYSKDDCGQCPKCGEWCAVLDPCCGWPVYFEGHMVTEKEIEEQETEQENEVL